MSETVFASEFVLAGSRHTRCEKPTCALAPQKHIEFALPENIGKAHLDIYADYGEPALYGRLYHMPTGEVAWYRIAADEVTP